MKKRVRWGCLLILIGIVPAKADEARVESELDVRRTMFKKITADFQAVQGQYAVFVRDYVAKLREEGKTVSGLNEEEMEAYREASMKASPDKNEFANRYMELIEKDPADAVAFDCLKWIGDNRMGIAEDTAEAAVNFVLAHQIKNPKLGSLLGRWQHHPSLSTGKLLRTIVETHSKKEMRGTTLLRLAQYLQGQSSLARILQDDSHEPQFDYDHYYGKKTVAALKEVNVDELDKEVESAFEQVAREYADVSFLNITLGEKAERELFEIRHLSIGKTAPEIAGEDTDGAQFKLSDYRGKVVVLDFWGHW